MLAAAAEWVWVPENAKQLATAEYHVIAYPESYPHPTQVAWCRSVRSANDVIGDVAAQVRRWGRDRVSWWLTDNSQPGDLESRLRALGADHCETVDVLALDMTAGLPEVGRTAAVRCALVEDEATLRAANAVSQEVWGGETPTDEAVAGELAELSQPINRRAGFRVVAYIGDMPAATGGCTQADGVARLWGAATRRELRGQGAYRAVLLKRLAIAREHGATLGLVKGRVETSGPILRRIGFQAYGEERLYDLPL